MSGSRLGRGRVGRVALLGCGALAIIFAVFLYRSTSAEMARLRDLHVKCAQQQEALAAQLQVIYEYKVQLEKTLSNEKSSNAAAKEELQKMASKERSLRDKDSHDATQRFNSLQQHYKLLQTEHEDLKEDCKKKEAVALQNSNTLETTLKELRIQLKKAAEDKEKSMEHLKTKYTDLLNEKDQLEEKYENLKKLAGDNTGKVEGLEKKVIQLQRELENAKKSLHFSVGGVRPENSQVQPRHANEANLEEPIEIGREKPAVQSGNERTQSMSSRQQTSEPAKQPMPLQSPSESSSKPTSEKAPTRVKLPVGVPPIPRMIEPKDELESARSRESAGQAPPALKSEVAPESRLLPRLEDSAGNPEDSPVQLNQQQQHQQQQQQQQQQPRPNDRAGEQDRHPDHAYYKLKPGVQEVGDPHHMEKNGFENAGGNEDGEQYDEYNYKEPQNKNGDLHLEEGEDEREDEDDYVHNNVNAVKHE